MAVKPSSFELKALSMRVALLIFFSSRRCGEDEIEAAVFFIISGGTLRSRLIETAAKRLYRLLVPNTSEVIFSDVFL